MWPLTLAYGFAFGIAFGLAGVGSVFAVPILVYAVGLSAHQAVCVAMIAVSLLSALGAVMRWKSGEMDTANTDESGTLMEPVKSVFDNYLKITICTDERFDRRRSFECFSNWQCGTRRFDEDAFAGSGRSSRCLGQGERRCCRARSVQAAQ